MPAKGDKRVSPDHDLGASLSFSQGDVLQRDLNPFTSNLRAADNEINELETRRADLEELVRWAALFEPDEQAAELDHLRSELRESTSEFERLEQANNELAAAVQALDSKRSALERDARLGWNVLRLLTPAFGEAQQRLEAHDRERARLQERQRLVEQAYGQLQGEVARLSDQVTVIELNLARFASYQRVEVTKEIDKIDRKLADLDAQRDRLRAQADTFDSAVEGPLAEWRRYQEEFQEQEGAVAQLRSDLSRLEDDITWAEDLDRKISNASTKYERAMLHEQCKRRFGEGSPRSVSRTIRAKMPPLRYELRNHERQVTHIRRDLEKTEKRIMALASRASRDIRSLVVDGNNCCYEGDRFIGLNALLPLIQVLAGRFDVLVVFDASIRGLLGVGDDHLRSTLQPAQVHVVATRVKADETIIDIASSPTDWIISNDRFGEFREKAPIGEGRVIRHEILRGRVLVHELGVNEPLDEQHMGGTT